MVSESRERSPDRRDRRDSSGPRRSGPSRFGGGGGGAKPTGGARRAPPERRVFISNIPFEMKWQEVKDLFRHVDMFRLLEKPVSETCSEKNGQKSSVLTWRQAI